jgi:hypothetical protein
MKAGKKSNSKSLGKNTKEKGSKEEKEDPKKKGATSKGKEKDQSKNKNKEGDPKKGGEKGKNGKTEEKKESNFFNLDFIYRRERYTLEKISKKSKVSKIKRNISEKISVDEKLLKFYYKDKELKEEDKDKVVFEMIKGDTVPFIEVKKEQIINQNIVSLNTKVMLTYKVKCSPVKSYIDLVNKIEQFFKDICIEKHYLCEPIDANSYYVCFSCSDHCFQFKRYMMNISRIDENYKDTTFVIPHAEKIKEKAKKGIKQLDEDADTEKAIKIEKMIVQDKKTQKPIEFEFRKVNHKESDYFQKEFINSGPYESYEEIKKKEEKDDKKKWISKKNFSAV